MIDLTPLDVRKKHEDFNRILRGFDPQEVQTFLEMVAERMEELVRENLRLKERSESLQQQVTSQTGREQAVQDALVTAQELRGDIQRQAQKEAELIVIDSQTEARRLLAEAEAEVRSLMRDAQRKLDQGVDALQEMERRRVRFLKAFRQLLEREMDVVEVEEARAPLEDRTIEMELGGGRPQEAEEMPALEGGSGATVAESGPSDGMPDPAGTTPDGFSSSAVDESAAQRPPMDVSIDDLAQSYGEGEPPAATPPAEAPPAGAPPSEQPPAPPADPTLFNSVDEDSSSDDGRWG